MRYQQFRDDTYPRGQRASTYRRSMRLPDLDNGMLFYPIQEEGAGWAIAAGLASRGLYRNAELQEYITYVGNMVAAASHGYDLGFKFYVLNVSEKQSYSTPGGFIFVTKGLLQQLESEAELVAVLAHEIAHVTMRHGLKEMANTRNVVAADAAFRELDGSVERTDDERQTTESINNELITYRDRMYSMRNQDFEKEADAMALAYTARAGYSPQAMLNVVTRLQNAVSSDAPIYAVNELNNRRDALLAELAGPKWRGNLMTNAPRYLDIRSRIR
jgi:predicted Zn-dependent protease